MNWKVKNRLFFILQNIPYGKFVYYMLQKHLTKSVWLDDKMFIDYYASKVSRHVKSIAEFGDCPINEATFFEFGAGWDMLAPIGFALNDAKRYIAVDLNSYAHPELVKNTLDLYKRNCVIDDLKNKYRIDSILSRKIDTLDKLLYLLKEIFSIEYYAPMDAANTQFKPKCIDYVISNVSLEHIPYKDIERIFKECYRLLKDDGLLSVTIDYTDHYSHTDPNISVFNYMKYSDEQWKAYNPYLHYQNRLKQSDYIALFEKSGFQIISIKSKSSSGDFDLSNMTIDERFMKYSHEELLILEDHFLVKKLAMEKQ